jgi:hypothetical protein
MDISTPLLPHSILSRSQVVPVRRFTLTDRATARLVEISEQDRQLMAALGATKALLEGAVDPAQRGASLAAPGLVIHIAHVTTEQPVLDLKPATDDQSA